MGTGVGEAMLIGAAVGGGSSALTGGDPLKGAMMGAATGAIGGAFAAPGFDPTALAGATEAGSIAGTSSLNAAIDPSLASISTMSPQAVSQGVSSGAASERITKSPTAGSTIADIPMPQFQVRSISACGTAATSDKNFTSAGSDQVDRS